MTIAMLSMDDDDAADLRGAIAELLESLGSEPWQIAETLASRGVCGVRGEADDCPITNLINREFPDAYAATGTDEIVLAAGGDAYGPDTVRLPGPVRDFVRDFDDGCWPNLCRAGA